MEKRVRRVGIVGFGRLGIAEYTYTQCCFTVSIVHMMWSRVTLSFSPPLSGSLSPSLPPAFRLSLFYVYRPLPL